MTRLIPRQNGEQLDTMPVSKYLPHVTTSMKLKDAVTPAISKPQAKYKWPNERLQTESDRPNSGTAASWNPAQVSTDDFSIRPTHNSKQKDNQTRNRRKATQACHVHYSATIGSPIIQRPYRAARSDDYKRSKHDPMRACPCNATDLDKTRTPAKHQRRQRAVNCVIQAPKTKQSSVPTKRSDLIEKRSQWRRWRER